jgi:hypothetical protein
VRWHDKRTVVALVAAVCGAIFLAGMGAAWINRDDTICSDRKEPVAERGGVMGQVVYQCHDGQIVTLNN